MEPKIRWVETDKHVYGAIYREHQDSLIVFGAISDATGIYGTPLMMTEWGFRDASVPLMKSEDRGNQVFKYYLAVIDAELT